MLSVHFLRHLISVLPSYRQRPLTHTTHEHGRDFMSEDSAGLTFVAVCQQSPRCCASSETRHGEVRVTVPHCDELVWSAAALAQQLSPWAHHYRQFSCRQAMCAHGQMGSPGTSKAKGETVSNSVLHHCDAVLCLCRSIQFHCLASPGQCLAALREEQRSSAHHAHRGRRICQK